MQIRKKLPVFIALLVAIPLMITSSVVEIYTSKTLESDALSKISSNGNLGAENISSLIMAEKKEVELLSQQKDVVEISKVRQDNVNDDFFQKYINHKAFEVLRTRASILKDHEHLFVIDANGEIFADSNNASLKIDLKSRKYFQDAIQGKTSISDTLVSKANGRTIIVFVAPIKDESGKVIAVMADSVYTDYFTNKLTNLKLGKTGYPYVVDKTGIMISHPVKEKINKPVENDKIKEVVSRVKSGEKVEPATGSYIYNGTNKFMSYSVIPEVNWTFVITQNVSEVNEAASLLFKIIIITSISALILAIAVGVLMSKGIANPVNQLMNLMDKASNGDITVSSDINSKDELGNLGNSFNKMMSNIKVLVLNIDEAIAVVLGSIEILTQASDESVKSIANVSVAIENIAEGAAHQSKETDGTYKTSENLGVLIDKAALANSEIQNYSTSIEQSNSMGKNTIKNLMDKTNRGTELSKGLGTAINNLYEKSSNIKNITNAITGIAEQTNLLALNAAIEAARAGEQGRGFAVVADEVRKLAEQSGSAAHEIDAIIIDIEKEVYYAVSTARDVSSAISEQVIAVENTQNAFDIISEKINNITNKISEMDTVFMEVKNGKEKLVDSVQNIASICEETAASSEEVSASTQQQTEVVESIAEQALSLKDQIVKLEQSAKVFKIE